jgi:hypothetical protein
MRLVDVPWPSRGSHVPDHDGTSVPPASMPETGPPAIEPADPAPKGRPGVLGFTRSEDGRWEAFVNGARATLVLRDRRNGVTHELVDRRLRLDESAPVQIHIGECVSLVVENLAHMEACRGPFRVVGVMMQGR